MLSPIAAAIATTGIMFAPTGDPDHPRPSQSRRLLLRSRSLALRSPIILLVRSLPSPGRRGHPKDARIRA